MKIKHSIESFLIASLLAFLGGLNVEAQSTTFTTISGATGNWSAPANWAGGTAPTGNQAGSLIQQNTGGASVLTLDVASTIGLFRDQAGSARNFTIDNSPGVAMTFDNTGGTTNNINGDLNASISSSSSGAIVFQPNIIIQNTDLEIEQAGSTTPSGSIGILGTTTITATSPRNLILIQNEAKAGEKVFTINSSIGATGSFITVSNVGPGTGPWLLAGVVGPNANVIENSVTNGSVAGITSSTLELGNSGNNYTGPTIITNGTIQLTAANAIPASSTVTIYGTSSYGPGELLLAGLSDTIGGLNGSGVVMGAVSGTPIETLTVGGGNASGNFSGVISNNVGTLNFAKTGGGTQVLSNTNFYSGTTTFGGGFLNAGAPEVPGTYGPFSTNTIAGSLLFSGGTLQYSTADQQDYSFRFSTGGGQPISIDLAAQSVSFATALAGSSTSLSVTDSVGGGTLNLTAAETYTGNTTVNGGTLSLSGSGALSPSSTINIGAGASFNVTGFSSSTYTLGSGAKLGASGYGVSGLSAATIVAAAGGFNVGSQGLVLTWGGGSSGTDSTHPALVVSGGALQFSGNSINVVVPGTALSAGTYTLISATSISGSPSSTPDYTGGNGVAPGNTGIISVSGNSVILTVASSGATVATWTDGSGSPNAWTTAGNWSGGVPQTAGSSATFGTVVSPVVLNANETVGLLNFTNLGNYTISGSSILTLNDNGAGVAVKVTGGSNTISAPVSLSDSSYTTVITANSGTALSLGGNVSSTTTNQQLTLNGAGITALSGANSYGPAAGTVGTILSGGILQVGNSQALAQGDLSITANSTVQAGANVSVANNVLLGTGLTGTVDNNGYNLALNGAISGSAGVTAVGIGKLTLNGTNTYSGSTVVNAGVLSLSSESNVQNTASIALNGGDLLGSSSFTLSPNIGIGAGTGIIGGTALIDAASSQTLLVGGVVGTAGNAGVNNLTINSKSGDTGELILSNANTFNGTTIISQGTLDVANPLALQNSSLNLSSGTLVFDSSITAATFGGLIGTETMVLSNQASQAVTLSVGGNNSAINYNNIVDASLGGSLTKLGGGAMTVTNANFSGNLTVGQGSLTILNGAVGNGSSTITTGNGNGGANLTIENSANLTAQKLNNGLPGGSTGSSIDIFGNASANFDFNAGDFQLGNNVGANVQLGGPGDSSGQMLIDTTGTVALGNFLGSKDSTATTASTLSGLVISNGTVTATSVTISFANSGANLNIYGGSLTITTTDSVEDLVIGDSSSARGGFLSMFGGSLTYQGLNDGLLLTPNSVDGGEFSIQGGTAILSGINLDASGSDQYNSTNGNPCVSVTGGALYLGPFGLYNADPTFQSSNEVVLGGGILGAYTNWDASSVFYVELTNTATIQAADPSANPWNIELDGILNGPGSLIKTGSGELLLTSNETYTGSTTISAGTLALSGTASIVSSPILIGAAGTFDVSALSSTLMLATGQALGNSISTGTIKGNVNATSGALDLNYSAGTPSLAIVSGTLSLGAGTAVTVTNTGAALVAGNTYTLIASGVSGTAPSSVTLAGNAGGVAGSLRINGGALQLAVSQSASRAAFTGLSVNGTTLTISATNGAASGQFTLLETTNLLLPLNQWTPVLTNNFNGSGNLVNFSTNVVNPNNPREFYLLLMP